ncbi:MAG: hypothetical protein ABI356_15475 [Steroidobacteraceae bacterium]
MKSFLVWFGLCAWSTGAFAADAAAVSRVEARSNDLLAVGVVHGDKMIVHISRLADNAPVRDATVSVMLRGTVHPTTAEADGSYSLQTQDLELPGAAAVDFQVGQGAAKDSVKGTLNIGSQTAPPDDRNSSRQLWWWVLNFAVCGAAVWLFARRRKAAKDQQS